MALSDTGMRNPGLSGTDVKTHDGAGKPVVVSASHEAIQDHGWDAIIDVASDKYDAGNVEPNSNPPRVRVTTADF